VLKLSWGCTGAQDMASEVTRLWVERKHLIT
jgi:hypothetical protein